MEFVAVADSIVSRTNRHQDTERLFQHGEVDNILLSVLVFIMETTLTEEQDCTIDAITEFISDILPAYNKQMSLTEREELSRYLIKDILQNKGEMRTYPIMDYSGGTKNLPVRLVSDKLDNDNKILYELTKQGFDFLFRTKEVDDELGFEIETIRLRMLISKKNYKKAISQSKYLIAMLIEKRNEIRQFEQQMRHDIFSVSGEQYDTTVRNFDATLKEEHEIMRDIEHMVGLAQTRLDEENRLFATSDEKSGAARREIVQISENVQRALGMQRELLIKCEDLRKQFLSLLQDSLSFYQARRYDIEEQLLRRMEGLVFPDMRSLAKLRTGILAPLFLPDLIRTLNLGLPYERQIKLREPANQDTIDEEETINDAAKLERIRLRNEAHVRLISLLLDYAKTRRSFLFSEFWNYIKTHKRLTELTAQRLMFLDILKLYEIREIDFIKWRDEGVHSQDCLGEFDLDYCLTCCIERDNAPYPIERMIVEKTAEWVICEINDGECIIIDDLLFEVYLNETDSTNS